MDNIHAKRGINVEKLQFIIPKDPLTPTDTGWTINTMNTPFGSVITGIFAWCWNTWTEDKRTRILKILYLDLDNYIYSNGFSSDITSMENDLVGLNLSARLLSFDIALEPFHQSVLWERWREILNQDRFF